MLFRFFRSSFLIQYIVIIFTGLLLWIPALMHPLPATPSQGFSPLYELLYEWIRAFPLFSTILAFTLLILQAFYFNAVLAFNLMIGRVSTAAAFIYVLVFSLHPSLTVLHPMLLAMPFVLHSFKLLLDTYESADNELRLFKISMLLSISGLIFFPFNLLVLWVIFTLFVFRVSAMREYMVPLIGFVTPYVYLFSIYFFQNQLITKLLHYSSVLEMFVFPPLVPEKQVVIVSVVLVVVFFAALITNYGATADRNIAQRKKKASVNLLIYIGLMSVFYKNGNSPDHALIFLPVAVHIAVWANTVRKYFWPHIFLLALLLTSIINNYLMLVR